jgi:hypothetical protein
MGASSTHPSSTSETGVDTLRLLFEVDRFPDKHVFGLGDGWQGESMPALGLLAVEGNPPDGALWSPDEVLARGSDVRELVGATFGLRSDRGVSRCDSTTSRSFEPIKGRALIGGMAALRFPRLERTARGAPVHSVWWTGEKTRAIKNRVYCESFKVEGREPFERVRLEDQRRFPNGHRPPLEVAADPDFQRGNFVRRFEPMRKAVDGVKAASFPVIAQALADEFKYGYRSHREVERLAGTLIILTGGASEGYPKTTLWRRRAELREAGYVVVDDFMEPVEVDLGHELEVALEGFGG